MFEYIYKAYDCVYFMNIFWPVGSILESTIFLIFLSLVLLILRAVYLSYRIVTSETLLFQLTSFKLIICIGSGGHTTEMIELVKRLNGTKYRPRMYLMADNDDSSEAKVHELENGSGDYLITKIPRSRNVNQSYISSILSTLHSTLFTVPIIYKFRPDAILCNGPGTCVPVCAIAFLFRCLFMLNCRIVFVESVCRVRTLSLTGKILQFMADIFVVQWPELRDVCLKAQYYGRLT